MYRGNCNNGQWMQSYEAAKRYFKANGHLNVPATYKTSDGIALGKGIARQRSIYLNPEKTGRSLSQDRIDLLEKIGMV